MALKANKGNPTTNESQHIEWSGTAAVISDNQREPWFSELCKARESQLAPSKAFAGLKSDNQREPLMVGLALPLLA